MSDLIKREDAIKVISDRICDNKWVCECAINSLPSANDVLKFHEDGTLEVKVPNAVKVGRVLVIDEVSSIGGGLYYPNSDDDNWIPVSERLPQCGIGMHYLVTLKDGHCFKDDVYEAFFDKNGWHMGNIELADDDVIAWMPLPTPYKGGDDE